MRCGGIGPEAVEAGPLGRRPELEARQSVGRPGTCWDNAVAESFFATLEHELIELHDWGTHTQARHDIFVFIEEWYNRERQHSSLGHVSPVRCGQVRFAHYARAA